MQTLALDLSSKSTGVAIFDDTKLIKYNCVTAASQDPIKRIQKITNELRNIVQEYKIQQIILEEVLPNGIKNQKTYKTLMWTQGSVMFMLHDLFPTALVEFVYPSSWRAQCGIKNGRGIKREEEKAADIEFVKEKYNIIVNDDIADAICIGHAYVNKLNDSWDWT